MNKPRPWKCPWTSSKKRKKQTKNENTAMNEQAKVDGKLRLRLSGIKPAKESRVLIDKGALMIVHVLSGWFASSYPIRRAFLQHISWRVSVESVINKRKSSCHFAWRNGSIAVRMFVHPTEYDGDIGLKVFLISQKLFLSTSEYHHLYYQGGRWNIPEFLKSPYNSLSKVYRFIWSCRFVFLLGPRRGSES